MRDVDPLSYFGDYLVYWKGVATKRGANQIDQLEKST